MKTSLMIEDNLFMEAEKEARKEGRTISETISYWARVGREALRQKRKKGRRHVRPVDLGAPKIDLHSRRHWMEILGR